MEFPSLYHGIDSYPGYPEHTGCLGIAQKVADLKPNFRHNQSIPLAIQLVKGVFAYVLKLLSWFSCSQDENLGVSPRLGSRVKKRR